MRGSRRGTGVRTPLENHKAIAIVINTDLDPKLPNQHSILGHHRPASETPFKWRFAGMPMMASF